MLLHPRLVPIPQSGHPLCLGIAHVEQVRLQLGQDFSAEGLLPFGLAFRMRQVLLELLLPLARFRLAVLVMLQELGPVPLLLDGRGQPSHCEFLHLGERPEELEDVAGGVALLETSKLRHDVGHGLHLPAELQRVLLQREFLLADLVASLLAPVRCGVRNDVELLEPHLLRKLLHELRSDHFLYRLALLALQACEDLRCRHGQIGHLLLELVHDGDNAPCVDIRRLRRRHGCHPPTFGRHPNWVCSEGWASTKMADP
mmetsp:Transcript_76307/g.220455  ORF Transcript_76307/g.220455 Transcript_76307/m.220455 type:complete len:257 (+) Transcript_76307:527-1297(+)